MDNQVTSVSAYDQTKQVRENQGQDPNIDALILAGPEAQNQVKALVEDNSPDDAALRPVDSFQKADAPKPAEAAQAAPPSGAPVPVDESDFAFPLDGRGAAVALQENLKELLENDKDKFAAVARALGVDDLPGFQDLVENASSLDVFSQIEPSNIVIVNQNREQVDPDQLGQLVNAEVIVKPGFDVRSDAGIKDNPVEEPFNPIDDVLAQLQTPVVIDPEEFQRQKAIDPTSQGQQDASPAVV